MKKLLLCALICLAGCGKDRYDYVQSLESNLPGANAEAFTNNYYVVSFNGKSVVISNDSNSYFIVKTINTTPEEDCEYPSSWADLILSLRKRLGIEEKVEKGL